MFTSTNVLIVSENLSIGDRIIQLNAIDADSGTNGEVNKFSIAGGNEEGVFTILIDTIGTIGLHGCGFH